MNLREIYGDMYSRKAFQLKDGFSRLIGKHGEIEIVGDKVDLWFKGTKRKVTFIAKQIPGMTILDGEAYIQTDDVEKAKEWSKLMGIKKRKIYSPEALEQMRERIRNVRPSRK